MELRKTEQRLLDAVGQIIENDGFAKIGINRVARVAGCDKVLIYRYFGGIEGLLTAWAGKYDFYSFAYSLFANKLQHAESSDIKEVAKEVLIKQLKFLRESTLMQELLAWELSGNTSFNAIRKERENNGFKLQQEFENMFQGKAEDSRIHITILIAAINFIVLSTREYNMINGINFNAPSSWTLLEEAICNYIEVMFNSIEQ